MPRAARVKHNEAIYHVMMCGNNKERLFFDDCDRVRYLEILKRYKEKYQLSIYAYCLLDITINIIIDCSGHDISKIMQGINLSYTQHINRKYNRSGHLFQDRFKSIILESTDSVIKASKYIHKRPVNEGLCEDLFCYKWSSINVYRGRRDEYSLVNMKFILSCFNNKNLYFKYVRSNIGEDLSQIEANTYLNTDKRKILKFISPEIVLQEVSEYFNVGILELEIRCGRRVAKARQVAAYLLCLKSRMTYREIGNKLGVTASAIGQNISKALELIKLDNDLKLLINC